MEVKSSEILEKIEKGESVDYDKVKLIGSLDLDKLDLPTMTVKLDGYEVRPLGLEEHAKHVNSSISITNSMIMDAVKFNDTVFFQSINFEGSKFYGSFNLNETEFKDNANFKSSKFYSNFNIQKSKFNRIAIFNASQFYGTADFSNAKFENGVFFEGANFYGDAIFEGASGNFRVTVDSTEIMTKIKSEKPAYYNNVVIFGDLELNWSEIEINNSEQRGREINSSIIIKNSEINGSVDFKNTVFRGIVDFSYTKFIGSVDFKDSIFRKFAYFSNSKIYYHANFSDAQFDDRAYFINTSIKEGSNFENVSFKSDAYFIGSVFGDTTDFRKVKFCGDANFIESKFKGDVHFSNATFNDAYFITSEFIGNVTFGSTRFFRTSNFIKANFRSDAFFDNAIFSRGVIFKGAQFNGYTSFVKATIIGDADFRSAKFQNLHLSGLNFTRLFVEWDSIGHPICDSYETYLALIKNFEDTVQYDSFYDCIFQYRREHMSDFISDPISWFSFVSCGFGVRFLHPLSWSAFIIFVFSIIFWHFNGIYQHDQYQEDAQKNRTPFTYYLDFKGSTWADMIPLDDNCASPCKLSFKDALYFSTLNFVSSSPADWRPRDKLKWKLLVMVEDVSGWIFLAIFIATLSNVIIR